MKATMRWMAAALLMATLAACESKADTAPSSEPVPTMPAVEVAPPESGTARADALLAMKHASNFVLYSLEPWTDRVSSDSEGFSCRRGNCLAENAVLGQVNVTDAASLEVVRTAVRESLGKIPNYATACIAEYRHAIGFDADGKRYRVFLCYGCGQLGIEVDGQDVADGEQTFEMGDEKALNAILARAGIPLAKTAPGAD